MTRWARLLGCAVALLWMGCEAPTVEGSLGELVDLRYQQVKFTFQPPIDFTLPPEQRLAGRERMRVSYVTPQGDGENTIWSVTVYVADLEYGVEWNHGEVLPLAGRGQVGRNVLDEPGRSWPRIERGTFLLGNIPIEGRPVLGSFSVTFENGTEFASGRTAFDTFQAELEQP